MRRLLAAMVILTAGCAGPGPDAPAATTDAGPTAMTIEGSVFGPTGLPLLGVNLSIPALGLATISNASGEFAFRDLVPRFYLVNASLEGYRDATLVAEPDADGVVGLQFVLEPTPINIPRVAPFHLQGIFTCALEAFIISPSCDTLLVAANDAIEDQDLGRPLPEPFDATNVLEFSLDANWKTIVVDLDFDPAAQPGIDGLRFNVQGVQDETGILNYRDYGKFSGTGPFTVRLEPDQSYPEGVEPLPGNATRLRMTVYPLSYFYHAFCDPPYPQNQPCPLGFGAGIDVQFDLYVHVFYAEPAPEGYSFFTTPD